MPRLTSGFMADKTDIADETGQVLAALSAAGDVAYVWDVASDSLRWHGALDSLEFDFASISAGGDFAARIHGDDRPLRAQRLAAHLNQNATFDCEYRLRLDNGHFAWFHDRGAAEPDPSSKSAKPQRVLGVLRLISGRKAAEQRLEHLANYDELTGHYNKQRLREALDHVIASSLRTGDSGAYLAVGIDKLSNINDAFGYEAADAVIIEIGQRLDRCLRVSDVIGRVGGDRFGIVLANCAEQNIAIAAEKILGAVEPDADRHRRRPGLRHGFDRLRDVPRAGQDLLRRHDPRRDGARRGQARRPRLLRALPHHRGTAKPPPFRHGAGRARAARAQGNRLVFAYQPVVAATPAPSTITNVCCA